ncbi:complement factor H-like [Liasis olivaceus]
MKGRLLLVAAFLLWPSCSSPSEITCNPPRISNGSFRPQRTAYQDGDLIRFQCDHGFNFEADNAEKVVECTRNGWSPSPKCVEITCQADYIEHGTILSVKNIYKEGDRIRFSCDEGYTHVDRSDALCTENGWGPKVQCVEIQCHLPQVTNGRVQLTRPQYMYNDAVEIICAEGFVFGGPGKTSRCTANGWSPPAVCKRRGCDYICIENGRLSDYYEWNKPFPRWEGQTIDFYCYHEFLPANKQTWHRATCINSHYVPELVHQMFSMALWICQETLESS